MLVSFLIALRESANIIIFLRFLLIATLNALWIDIVSAMQSSFMSVDEYL